MLEFYLYTYMCIIKMQSIHANRMGSVWGCLSYRYERKQVPITWLTITEVHNVCVTWTT